MENDPDLQVKARFLGSISEDFAKISDTLKEASFQVRKRNFSEYPIIPVSKEEISIGSVLIEAKKQKMQWNFSLSFMEELVQRGLMDAQKVKEFKEIYKNPDEFCCLLVVSPEFVNYIFIPYPIDDEN